MEKNILQRLFGFLWDLSYQRKADPPSGDDPGDKWRPRLTVIEGGKGKGKWDGNERRKPCAVIGIPYSSDAADDTVEKEEESIMKHIAKYMYVFAAVAAAAFALSACGGGGGGGGGSTPPATSAPVVSIGTMTKGSVIVNGVRFEDTAANIHPDDTNKVFLPGDLKDGMTVKVRGEINDDRVTGRAIEIEVENEVRGTITAKGADSLTVLGQTVFVDGGTVFANVANFAALAVGQAVEVHGQRDAAGAIRATRVELISPLPVGGVVDEVRGVVANKTPGPPPGTFTIGGALFTYDALTVIVDPAGGATFADGALVEIHLDAGTNRANRIEIEDDEDNEFDPAEGQEFEVEGFVTGLAGNNFSVNGQAVSLKAGTGTRFEGGLPSDLANNVRVETEGHMVAGVLVADKITFKDSVRMETNATAASAASFTAFGKTVNITGTTDLSGATLPITAGTGLRIRAFLNNDNTTFTATRIDTLSNPVSASQQILQGTVSSFNATARTLVIFGLTVDASGVPANEVQNDNDVVISFDQFFGAITLNRTFVKARGSFSGSTLTANKIELE
jgi:hypothetical protein